MINQQLNRRQFIKASSVASAGVWLGLSGAAYAVPRARIEQINFACIGVGGKGDSDTADAARFGNVAAICDIDDNTLSGASEKYPSARTFHDFREMLNAMGDGIDAVTVSTPDHTHAIAAARAMKMGKHCFCQKPMTHSIQEASYLGELALRYNLATQMGNQGTAADGLRKAAAILKSGALGRVKEVHVWSNRPVWPQGDTERPPTVAVPDHVHWTLWLGPAPPRDYAVWPEKRGWGPREAYHPFNWRGWWDFGTGALGDMACHTLNMPFMGLDLRDPVSVQAETSGHNGDSFPQWSRIRYEFPARGDRPALTMYWYDGGQKISAELLGEEPAASGSLCVGEKGKLYSPGDNGNEYRLIGIAEPAAEWPKSPGHFAEFARAIEGSEPAMSNFPQYATPLTETVLLGNLAVWADGKKIEWDPHYLVATNAPEVDRIIRKEYPDGWGM